MFRTTVFMLCLHLWQTEIRSLNCGVGQYQRQGVCIQCRNPCAKCISEHTCTECEAGFYGDGCTKNCSEGCNDGICLQSTGECESCKNGYYATENKTCMQCPELCTNCRFADQCTSCKIGFTGRQCVEKCINCKPGSGCSLRGVCDNGCKDGYTGISCIAKCTPNCRSCDRVDASKCKSCVNGKHGISCEKRCPSKCENNSCIQTYGDCSHGCKPGYWGEQCEYLCPENCRRAICYRESGVCTDGCYEKFTGKRCLCPSTCECDEDGACKKCSDNSGFICNAQCTSACLHSVCSTDGQPKCLYGCRAGYSGSLCEHSYDRADNRENMNIFVVGTGVSAASILATVILIVTGLHLRKRIRRRTETVSDDLNMASTTVQEKWM